MRIRRDVRENALRFDLPKNLPLKTGGLLRNVTNELAEEIEKFKKFVDQIARKGRKSMKFSGDSTSLRTMSSPAFVESFTSTSSTSHSHPDYTNRKLFRNQKLKYVHIELSRQKLLLKLDLYM